MLTKVLALLQSKVALAAVGAVLVGGTGVAVAATQGKITLPGAATTTHTTDTSATHTPESTAAAIHAHTVSIEGTLVTCGGGATTICVKDAAGKTWQVQVNASTEINGDHALVGKDLATLTGHRVQVQATAQAGGTYIAWKVTLEGPSSTAAATGNDGKGNDGTSQGQHVEESGSITALASNGFTLTLENGSQQGVTVSASTLFAGQAHQLSDLKAHMHVAVQGTLQADNTLAATRVEASA
jgi:hypothetical protein